VSIFDLFQIRRGDFTEHAAKVAIIHWDTNKPFTALLGVSAPPMALRFFPAGMQ
jgi:hypothetical protein